MAQMPDRRAKGILKAGGDASSIFLATSRFRPPPNVSVPPLRFPAVSSAGTRQCLMHPN